MSFYVYELRYPPEMGGSVFYVGKGTRNRIDHHEYNAYHKEQGRKADTIRAIWAAGHNVVKVKVFTTDLEDEALAVEQEYIERYGYDLLTNVPPPTGGHYRFHTSFKDDATLERLDVLSKRWGVTRPEVIDLLTRFAVNGEPLPDPPASDGNGAGS